MSKTRILVIDDEKTVRNTLQKLLLLLDCEVVTAKDGIAGLEAYNAHLPDIVITDLGMPGKNGLELIADIKGRDPEQKILAITGLEEEFVQRALEAGADGLIQKPFGFGELEETIDHWRKR